MTTDNRNLGSIPLYIGGEFLPIDTSNTFDITTSSTGSTAHSAQSATIQDVLAAASSAKNAFKTWKNSSHTTRRDLLLRTADIIQRRIDEFIEAQIQETSCTKQWAQFGTQLGVQYLRKTAACVSSVTGTIPQLEKPDAMGFVFKQPIGPVLTIPPWNGAVVLAVRAVGTAVAAGCTVVFKASELSPRTHHLILEAFLEAGLPKEVINKIQVRREDAAEITETLIAHDAIRNVEFIGSAAVGRIIGAVAAKHSKPVLMELGGKCPAIVLNDAPLEQAAKMCAIGAVTNHSQICFSTERVIVLQSVAEKFQRLLIAEMESNGEVAGYGVTQDIAQHAVDVLKDAEQKGHQFLTGSAAPSKALKLRPALILNPSQDARIFDEETFSPSASLCIVPDDVAAIELANASAYGLDATIHSTNMERALKLAKELEYGQVHVNSSTIFTSPTASQGGVKGSGWGRQNARWGLGEFYVDKFVSWHAPPQT